MAKWNRGHESVEWIFECWSRRLAATNFICPGIVATETRIFTDSGIDRDHCGDQDEPKKNLHILASSHSCLAAISLILLSLMGVLR
jgi:hypothetical protein